MDSFTQTLVRPSICCPPSSPLLALCFLWEFMAGTCSMMVIQEGVLPMLAARSQSHQLIFVGVPLSIEHFDLALRAAPLTEEWFSLFNLSNDPEEQKNILSEQPETATLLCRELVRWRKSLHSSSFQDQKPMDPEFRELLCSWG
jgi:hypothetical protein